MGKASTSVRRGQSISDRLSPRLQKELEFFSIVRTTREMQQFRQASVSSLLSKIASEYIANAKRHNAKRQSTITALPLNA